MVGPERGRYRTKVERMLADAAWAEDAGLASVWVPQIPDDFGALTAAALIGAATSRIEIGTAVVPINLGIRSRWPSRRCRPRRSVGVDWRWVSVCRTTG